MSRVCRQRQAVTGGRYDAETLRPSQTLTVGTNTQQRDSCLLARFASWVRGRSRARSRGRVFRQQLLATSMIAVTVGCLLDRARDDGAAAVEYRCLLRSVRATADCAFDRRTGKKGAGDAAPDDASTTNARQSARVVCLNNRTGARTPNGVNRECGRRRIIASAMNRVGSLKPKSTDKNQRRQTASDSYWDAPVHAVRLYPPVSLGDKRRRPVRRQICVGVASCEGPYPSSNCGPMALQHARSAKRSPGA